jgi:hypothetical protein
MSYIYLLGVCGSAHDWLSNGLMKGRLFTAGIWRLLFASPQTWFILENGQFVSGADFQVVDKDVCWQYDGSTLMAPVSTNPTAGTEGLSSSSSSSNRKQKLPYLSLEFRLEGLVINMDNFISELKFSGFIIPPIPVIMAAFTIHTKTLHPWLYADFTLYDNEGNDWKFKGLTGPIVR